MGLGAFPSDDPLSLRMPGMHGTYVANMAMNSADLLIGVGARFDDRVTGKLSTFAPKAKIIHIDIDPTSIRKTIQVDVPVVGDCRMALEGIREVLSARLEAAPRDWSGDRAPWLNQLAEWAQGPAAYLRQGEQPQAPAGAGSAGTHHQRRGHHRHRGRSASDVVRAISVRAQAAHLLYFRRSGNYGLRIARGHRRTARPARPNWSSTWRATAPSR